MLTHQNKTQTPRIPPNTVKTIVVVNVPGQFLGFEFFWNFVFFVVETFEVGFFGGVFI